MRSCELCLCYIDRILELRDCISGVVVRLLQKRLCILNSILKLSIVHLNQNACAFFHCRFKLFRCDLYLILSSIIVPYVYSFIQNCFERRPACCGIILCLELLCACYLLNKLRKIALSDKSVYRLVNSTDCFNDLVIILAINYQISLLARGFESSNGVGCPDICLRFVLKCLLDLGNELIAICGYKSVNCREKPFLDILDLTVFLAATTSLCALQCINKLIPACRCKACAHAFIPDRFSDSIYKVVELLGNSGVDCHLKLFYCVIKRKLISYRRVLFPESFVISVYDILPAFGCVIARNKVPVCFFCLIELGVVHKNEYTAVFNKTVCCIKCVLSRISACLGVGVKRCLGVVDSILKRFKRCARILSVCVLNLLLRICNCIKKLGYIHKGTDRCLEICRSSVNCSLRSRIPCLDRRIISHVERIYGSIGIDLLGISLDSVCLCNCIK